MADYVDILLREGKVSPDQLTEAEQVVRDSGDDLGDCLARLQYVSSDDVMRAKAEQFKVEFVDLTEISIPESVIEQVPESVARENSILPMAELDDGISKLLYFLPCVFDCQAKKVCEGFETLHQLTHGAFGKTFTK